MFGDEEAAGPSWTERWGWQPGDWAFRFGSDIDFLRTVRQVTSLLRASLSSWMKRGHWVGSLLFFLVGILSDSPVKIRCSLVRLV